MKNPAIKHRLVPWLLRDLNVLLGNDDEMIRFVMSLILNLIPKYVVVVVVFFCLFFNWFTTLKGEATYFERATNFPIASLGYYSII